MLTGTMAVLDVNTNVVLPANGTAINSFSNWGMSLQAQVAGVAVTSYSWNFTSAADAGSISGSSSYNVQFTWASFTGAPRTDTVSVTANYSGGSLTQTFTYDLTATNSPAWSSAPTSSSTWPSVIGPDQLQGQSSIPAGPYASIGLADGAVQTGYSLPSYNPNVTPLGLVYNSVVADAQPIFQVRYQLDPTQALPTSVTAQLTLSQGGTTVYTGSTVYYNPSSLNPGDWMVIALQANCSNLPTARYNWQINLTANYTNPASPSYSGSFNLISGSTTPNSTTLNPFGPGWSLAGVERLWSGTGGIVLQNPDGTSLWFASSGGSYVTPPGDFSTLTQSGGVYTRTLVNGTKINFNSSGLQTSIVDRDSNTTSYSYNSSFQLTTVTDMNGKLNTISYSSTTGLATLMTDPANRNLNLGYNTSNQLIALNDPANEAWQYSYDLNNDMTSLSDPRSTGSNYLTTFTYDFAYRATSVTQPDNIPESLSFVQLGGLAGTGTGTSGNPANAVLWSADYATFTDPNSHNRIAYLDGLGFGNPVLQGDAAGDVTMNMVNSNGLAWLSADAMGGRTRFVYNTSGEPTQIVLPDDYTSGSSGYHYAYNSFGEMTQATDPAGNVQTYTYDGSGNLTQFTNPLNYTTTYSYNTAGLLTSMTDPLNHVTAYQYDNLNRLTTVTDALNHTETLAYNSASNLTSSTDLNGFTTSYTYDSMGRVLTETLPDSATVSSTFTYTYDSAGNPATMVMPVSTGVNTTYA